MNAANVAPSFLQRNLWERACVCGGPHPPNIKEEILVSSYYHRGGTAFTRVDVGVPFLPPNWRKKEPGFFPRMNLFIPHFFVCVCVCLMPPLSPVIKEGRGRKKRKRSFDRRRPPPPPSDGVVGRKGGGRRRRIMSF